jgi:hypothetical protein
LGPRGREFKSLRIDGKVIYLGPWDTPEAKADYHPFLVEWHGRLAIEATMEPPVTERGSSGGEKCR